MTTPVFICGAECGVTGTVGQHWKINGTAAISTSPVRNGARALRVNPTAGTGSFQYVSAAASKNNVARVAFNIATAPAVDSVWAYYQDNTNNKPTGLGFKAADSKWYPVQRTGPGAFTFGTTGITLGAGWHIADIKLDTNANPWLLDITVDGTALTQLSLAFATLAQDNLFLGGVADTVTADLSFDDILVSNTLADYPVGDGYVNHFVPVSDGTHTATTTTIVKGTIAAPTGGGNVAGATDVFNWVNGVPLLGGATDNTRLVNQQTAGATLYAEVVFGPAPGISTPTTGPRAVEVITADRQATTAAGDMHVKINDNGTEAVVLDRTAVAGVITDRFTTKQFATAPSTSAAWTSTGFNALRARFGYSSDATPDQYWRGIMVEAEFAAVVDAGGQTVDLMHHAQMPALLAQ